MNERVRRPKAFEETLERLGRPERGGNKSTVFESLKSALVFSASLALKVGLNRKSFSESSERIPFAYFSNEFDKSFILSLALNETEDVTILHPDRLKECLEIFEEYANAGLEYITQNLPGTEGSEDSFILSFVANELENKDIIDEITSISDLI